eukprot:scaffold239559_cov30-Tisochrysis_lutea.AAC.4
MSYALCATLGRLPKDAYSEMLSNGIGSVRRMIQSLWLRLRARTSYRATSVEVGGGNGRRAWLNLRGHHAS